MVQPSAPSPSAAPASPPRSHLATLILGAAALTLAAALAISLIPESGAGNINADDHDQEEDPAVSESASASGPEDIGITLGHPRGALTPGQDHLRAVAREASAELGLPLTEVDVSSAGYNNGIKRQVLNGQLDMALTDRTFSANVCRGYGGAETSTPVARLLDALLLPSGNPNDLNGLEDVVDQDLVLGVPTDGPYRERAEAAGVSAENLVTSEIEFLDVEDEKVDAILGDSQELTWEVEARESDLEVTEPLIPAVDGEEVEEYTGFYVSDPGFAEALDEVLATMRADGRLVESGEEWGMSEDHQPPESTGPYDACSLTGS